MLGFSSDNYSMYTAWHLLSEALSKQYVGYSDADLAAEIQTIQAEEKDIYAPLMAIHGALMRDLTRMLHLLGKLRHVLHRRADSTALILRNVHTLVGLAKPCLSVRNGLVSSRLDLLFGPVSLKNA